MVETILAKNPTSKRIYLTGTPSKFIERNYSVVSIPAITLIDAGYISDLYVGVFSTTADIKNFDRNSEDNVMSDSYKKLEKTVRKDCDSLMSAIMKRLTSSDMTKDKPNIIKLLKTIPAIGVLDKTMIACASIKQAEKVLQYMVDNGISAVLSNSQNDIDSLNIKRFEEEKDIKVLVVVDRAVLGFNMPNLVNVVDMTLSHNINRIYQLYARVMRKNENNDRKYFFKLATEEEMHVTKFYMEASLCLMYEYFITKYNGKNLNEMQIPVKLGPKKSEIAKLSTSSKGGHKVRDIRIDESLFETVTAAKIMTDLYNKTGQELNEYAMVNFREIRRNVFGEDFRIDGTSPKTLWESMVEMGIAND
jgi:Helicase conserved C-terminal domain